jgi:hypothetical protein
MAEENLVHDKGDERREMLASQLDDAPQTEAAAPEPVEKTAPEAKASQDGRARGQDGKFVAKEEKTETSEPVTEVTWKAAPKSWKKELHELYGKADPKVQEYIHARETEMRAGVEGTIPKLKEYDAIQKTVEPYMHVIRGQGMTVPQAIDGLMKADLVLRSGSLEQKQQALARIIQYYGIPVGDVRQLPQVHPANAAMQQQFNALRAEVVAERQQREAVEAAQTQQEIGKFSESHEYFEELKPTMIELLRKEIATGLDDAYTKALRLNEDVFTRHQQSLQAQSEAGKRAEKDRAAKAAKAHAVSTKSSTPGASTAPKAQSRRAMLEESFGEQESRL